MPSCRKKRGEKNGKAYSIKLCQNRLRQSVLCQRDSSEKLCPRFSAKESNSRNDSLCLNIQSSPQHTRLDAFEAPQLMLRAMCKRSHQFTMLRLFAKVWLTRSLRNNSQQYATTCYRVCKRTQHITSNSSGSCGQQRCVRLQRSFIDESYFVKKRQ